MNFHKVLKKCNAISLEIVIFVNFFDNLCILIFLIRKKYKTFCLLIHVFHYLCMKQLNFCLTAIYIIGCKIFFLLKGRKFLKFSYFFPLISTSSYNSSSAPLERQSSYTSTRYWSLHNNCTVVQIYKKTSL